MKRVLLRLALVLGGLLFGLALTEAALRLLPLPNLAVLSTFESPPPSTWKDPSWQDPPDRAFRRHRTIGHEHAPDVDVVVNLAEHPGGRYRFRTNNLGLRRDEPTRELKPPDVFRVLVLGDSQTDGYVENEASFSTLLEARLQAPLSASGRRPEVLNAGVAGYSTAQEFLWFDVKGAELRPDLVVLVFYPGNDPVELLDPGKPNVNPDTGRVIRPREEEPAQPREPEGLRLALVGRYVARASPVAPLWQRLNLPGAATEVAGYPTDVLARVFRQCHGCYLQTLEQAAYARRDPAAVDQAVARAGAILARLDQEVRRVGARLVVAILPTRPQAEPERARGELASIGALLGLGGSDLVYDDRVVERVTASLSAAGIPALQLREPLAAAARAEQLYYSRDWHLNGAGHRAVAAALADALPRLDVLPTGR